MHQERGTVRIRANRIPETGKGFWPFRTQEYEIAAIFQDKDSIRSEQLMIGRFRKGKDAILAGERRLEQFKGILEA